MPSTLTDDEKRSLLEGHLKSFAIDAYGHEMNKQIAIASDDTEAITAADEAIAIITAAAVTYEAELEKLPTPISTNELTA
jgi:hypothetical protein